jgi:thioredoxin-related protein
MIKLLLAVYLFTASANPQWLNNLDTAKETAKKEKKLILLNFSGSDWCIPCIKLHDEVFNTEVFVNFAKDNLVLVNADFPRKKKNQLSKEQQSINDKLAEKYNPDGKYPYTLLLDSDGNKIKVWDGYYKNGAGKFIDEIKDITGR